MKLTKKETMISVIYAIVFIVYHVVFFVLCGFTGHTAGFWISWLFMLIAFAALGAAGILLGKKGMFLRDWIFGYPILRHSTIYIVAEFAVSTLFVLLDGKIPPAAVFAVQFILLGVYLVFAISCLLSKETIDEVHNKVKEKSAYLKLLHVDAELLCERCSDVEAKKVFTAFAEQVRLSDVMSHDALLGLENEISSAVAEAKKCLDKKDVFGAVEQCKKASLLLTERNRKSKALK